MFEPQDIELLKDQLYACYGKYVDILIDETGISRPTISKFFNNKPIKAANQRKIYRTAYKLIAKRRKENTSLVESMKQLTGNDSRQAKMNF